MWADLGAGVLVFIAAAVYDLAIGRYVLALNKRNGHSAGAWSVGAYLIGLIGLQSVLKYSNGFIIPECLGLYVGTQIVAYMQRRADRKAAAP